MIGLRACVTRRALSTSLRDLLGNLNKSQPSPNTPSVSKVLKPPSPPNNPIPKPAAPSLWSKPPNRPSPASSSFSPPSPFLKLSPSPPSPPSSTSSPSSAPSSSQSGLPSTPRSPSPFATILEKLNFKAVPNSQKNETISKFFESGEGKTKHFSIAPKGNTFVLKRSPDRNSLTSSSLVLTLNPPIPASANPAPASPSASSPTGTFGPRSSAGTEEISDIARIQMQSLQAIASAKQYSDRNSSSRGGGGVAGFALTGRRSSAMVKEVLLPSEGLTIRDLASKLSLRTSVLRDKLVAMGELQSAGSKKKDKDSQVLDDTWLDVDVAEYVVLEMGLKVKKQAKKKEELVSSSRAHLNADTESVDVDQAGADSVASSTPTYKPLPRAPVVCIMGHVDHGKTTLLDAVRKANVANHEAGGITQKLSAFSVDRGGRRVVFLDTPGHEAFSAMRSNGALATDVVVLVVAADDGVRPQTIEALKTALDAKCTIIVALSKMDKITGEQERKAARERVLSQLVNYGLVAEDYGGNCLVCEVSGKTGDGVDNLVEMLALQTDILELVAPLDGPAEATVLDAVMEKGRGVVADMLVRWGTVRIGDAVVVGTSFGKVKALLDDQGKKMTEAGPSTPVRLLGLRSVPSSGQELFVVDSESKAKAIADRRLRVQQLRTDIFNSGKAADVKATELDADGMIIPTPHSGIYTTVSVILKADGVGTLDALDNVVQGVKSRMKNAQINVIARSVGNVTASDIDRASAIDLGTSATCVLGFNISITMATKQLAKESDVHVVRDTVIYRLEDALIEFVSELMPKERILTSEGSASVLQVFAMNDKVKHVVAGLSVTAGRLKTSGSGSNAQYVYNVKRNGEVVVADLTALNLKRFKDTVYEVDHGTECGLTLEKFKDFQPGDEIECFRVEWVPRKLIISESSTK